MTERKNAMNAETDMNRAGKMLIVSVLVDCWFCLFIPNSECKLKGHSKEFSGMQESVPKVDK